MGLFFFLIFYIHAFLYCEVLGHPARGRMCRSFQMTCGRFSGQLAACGVHGRKQVFKVLMGDGILRRRRGQLFGCMPRKVSIQGRNVFGGFSSPAPQRWKFLSNLRLACEGAVCLLSLQAEAPEGQPFSNRGQIWFQGYTWVSGEMVEQLIDIFTALCGPLNAVQLEKVFGKQSVCHQRLYLGHILSRF